MSLWTNRFQQVYWTRTAVSHVAAWNYEGEPGNEAAGKVLVLLNHNAFECGWGPRESLLSHCFARSSPDQGSNSAWGTVNLIKPVHRVDWLRQQSRFILGSKNWHKHSLETDSRSEASPPWEDTDKKGPAAGSKEEIVKVTSLHVTTRRKNGVT